MTKLRFAIDRTDLMSWIETERAELDFVKPSHTQDVPSSDDKVDVLNIQRTVSVGTKIALLWLFGASYPRTAAYYKQNQVTRLDVKQHPTSELKRLDDKLGLAIGKCLYSVAEDGSSSKNLELVLNSYPSGRKPVGMPEASLPHPVPQM